MVRTPVPVAFACPLCLMDQQVGLVELSRAGFHRCTACTRRLTPAQVSHAIHAGPPVRAPRAPSAIEVLPGTRTRLLR